VTERRARQGGPTRDWDFDVNVAGSYLQASDATHRWSGGVAPALQLGVGCLSSALELWTISVNRCSPLKLLPLGEANREFLNGRVFAD